MFILIFFVLGAIFGSFINCLVYRLKIKKTLLGRSYCPCCKHTLNWLDLFPVFSYIFLRGKCRYCKKKIAFQYCFMEIFTGSVFAFGYYFYFIYSVVTSKTPQEFAFYLTISLFLIIIGLYDFKYTLVADEFIFPAIIFAFIYNVFLGNNVFMLLLGGFAGFSFFAIQYFGSRGKWIGGGDMFIGIFMGFVLSWPNVLIAIFISYIIGGIISMPLLILKLKKPMSQIPLGPFLVIGTFITMLMGDKIIKYLFFI